MRKRKLIKAEKETNLLTSEADNVWSIYTFNSELKKKLRKFFRKYPEKCRLIWEDPEIRCVTYEIDKSRVSIHLDPPQNPARRRAAAERIRSRKNSKIRKKKT